MIKVFILDADGVTIENRGLFSEYLEKHTVLPEKRQMISSSEYSVTVLSEKPT